MNLFVFASNGFVTPKMIKLERESRILTGGRFRFLMAPLLCLITVVHLLIDFKHDDSEIYSPLLLFKFSTRCDKLVRYIS